MKRVDVGVFNTVKAAKDGKFRGGTNLVFNLKNSGVALGKLSPRFKGPLKTKIMKKVNSLKKLIIKGKIKPPTSL